MEIKDFLQDIGIFGEDKETLRAFFEQPEIKDFLQQKWTGFLQEKQLNEVNAGEEIRLSQEESLPSESEPMNVLPEPPEEICYDIPEPIETNNEQEDTMDKFGNSPSPGREERAQEEAFELRIKSKPIVLQNGKVNQVYNFKLDPDLFRDLDIEEYWIEIPEEIGLVFDKEEYTIKGIPEKPGDFKLSVKCKKTGREEDTTVFERPVTLIINPDPRSLWNNIPTPENILYYKPDFDQQFVKVIADKGIGKPERKDIVAASCRGRSHAHEGNPRDDDFRIGYHKKDRWYIMTVADGAGSAAYSRKGSEIACETVSEICNQLLTAHSQAFKELIKEFHKDRSEEKRKKVGDALYNILGSAVFKAYKNIEQEAKQTNRSIREYSTTLILSICRKFRFGWFVAAFWVGDGGIGIYNKDTRFLKIMGESDGGEFAGQTRFLTMSEVMQPTEIYKRLRFDIVNDFTALILMTDGITDPKFETDANLLRIEKWDELWEDLGKEVEFSDDNEAAADQLLKWLDFWAPGNHDDRTIAILF